MEYSSILVCKGIRYGLMAKPGRGDKLPPLAKPGGGICPPLVVRADAPEYLRYDEVSRAIHRMNNKSPGENLIAGEMMKATVEGVGVGRQHDMLRLVWDSKVCP